MDLLFPTWTNTLSRLTLAVLLAVPALGIGALMLYVRTPLGTGEAEPIAQPIQFDHRHHVVDDAIDCRFCHRTVERGPSAGFPSTTLCMGCHAQLWNKSSLLDPVRESYFSGLPLRWVRVHNLPDFVYFNHASHVSKGVGCATCHGRVDRMAAIQQAAPLTMQWCLDCHRAPERHLRPREHITSMTWSAPEDALEQGLRLAAQYQVHTRTSCSTCHR